MNAQSLQQALVDLGKAFTNFYRKRTGFPRFKSRRNPKQSCRFPQNISVDEENDRIKVLKVGKLDAVVHRPLGGKLRSITISRNATNQHHAACLVEDNHQQPRSSFIGRSIGIDLGLHDLITTSDGTKVPHPKHYKKQLKQLQRRSQQLARCKHGSKRRAKARLRVAKLHLKIANARKDHLHKLSRTLVDENQVITFETLNIQKMMQNKWHAKMIGASGWSTLIEFTLYKALREGKVVLQAPLTYPSSKRCSCCGEINKKLKLSQREWTCAHCGTHHDRDINAGRNLDQWGQEQIYPALMLEQSTGPLTPYVHSLHNTPYVA